MTAEENVYIGALLRDIRLAKKKSLVDISKAVGLSCSSVSGMENGNRNISLHHFLSICRFLDEDPADILEQIVEQTQHMDYLR